MKQETREKMKSDKDKRMQIIISYWEHKGIDPDNDDQYKAMLKRELRGAGNLKGYEVEKIKRCMNYLDEQKYLTKWTLETVFKYIDEFEKNCQTLDTKEILRRLYG